MPLLRRWLAMVLVPGLLWGLVGCSEDPVRPAPFEPTDPASGSSSPDPTGATTSPSPTVRAESAEEFIRRWVREDIAMQNSGRTERFLALSDTCRGCAGLARFVEDTYAAGGFVRTQGWLILSIERVRVTEMPLPSYTVRVDSRPTEYRERAGAQIQRLDGGRFTYRFDLVRRGGAWFLGEYLEETR